MPSVHMTVDYFTTDTSKITPARTCNC